MAADGGKMTLERAMAELEASKTSSRRAREEVGDITLLLLQARAENKSLKRSLERSQGELRELNSALSHFEESHREELELHGNMDTATTKRKLTRAKLERALAEEQEAHRATRRQLELYKLAAAEATQTKSSNAKEGNRRSIFGFDKNKKRGSAQKQGPSSPFDGYDQHSDDDIPLSLEERKEEMERSSNEYRNVIMMLSEEIESLKNQLSTMTQAFEDHIPLSQLIPLATNSPAGGEAGGAETGANGTAGVGRKRGENGHGAGTRSSPSASASDRAHGRDGREKIRLIAARTIANLAAREERRQDIVGSLPQLLKVLHNTSPAPAAGRAAAGANGSEDSEAGGRGAENHQLQRLVCAAVANLSIDSKYQGEVVKLGGLEALSQLSREARDSQTLRMAAGALANLCANALLKESLLGKGVVSTLVDLQERGHHPDVEAQIARGLANWVVSTDELRMGLVFEEFATSGGLVTLLKLGGNRDADLGVKRQVGTAISHTFKTFPQMTKEHIMGSDNGIKPLLEMKKCADKEVSELAESSIKLYNDTMML